MAEVPQPDVKANRRLQAIAAYEINRPRASLAEALTEAEEAARVRRAIEVGKDFSERAPIGQEVTSDSIIAGIVSKGPDANERMPFEASAQTATPAPIEAGPAAP